MKHIKELLEFLVMYVVTKHTPKDLFLVKDKFYF